MTKMYLGLPFMLAFWFYQPSFRGRNVCQKITKNLRKWRHVSGDAAGLPSTAAAAHKAWQVNDIHPRLITVE